MTNRIKKHLKQLRRRQAKRSRHRSQHRQQEPQQERLWGELYPLGDDKIRMCVPPVHGPGAIPFVVMVFQGDEQPFWAHVVIGGKVGAAINGDFLANPPLLANCLMFVYRKHHEIPLRDHHRQEQDAAFVPSPCPEFPHLIAYKLTMGKRQIVVMDTVERFKEHNPQVRMAL